METTRRPFMPPSRADAAADWRRSFVNVATVKVLAQLRKTNADEVRLEIRAPVTPMKVGDFPGSAGVRLMLLAPKSTIAQLVPLATTVDLSGVEQFTFPMPTNFANASFVGEGQPIPVRQGAFSGFGVGPVRKVALISALSNELEIATGGIAQIIINHTLEVAVGRGLDAVLFSANAATAIAPAGLLNGVVPITGSVDIAKDLGALVGSISAAGIDTSSVVFIAAPSQAMAISLLAGPHFTHQIIEASSLADGTVVAVATAALVFAGEGVPQISTSKQATLNFAYPAAEIVSAAGIAAVPTLSPFQSDLLALKCTAMITWSCAPGSIAMLTGATWSKQQATSSNDAKPQQQPPQEPRQQPQPHQEPQRRVNGDG